MTQRLERLIPKIRDQFMREFLTAADDKGSAAGHYVVPALETLAEKWLVLEKRAQEAQEQCDG